MEATQPSGLRLPLGRAPLFDAIKSGRAYFVLARDVDKWGTLTHFRIARKPLNWPHDYLPNDSDDFIEIGKKFFDRNSSRRYSGLYPDTAVHMFIGRAPKGTTNIVLEDQAATGILHAAYFGDKWVSATGLNDAWSMEEGYDYYLLNFNGRTETAVKIEAYYSEVDGDENEPSEVMRAIAEHPRCAEAISDALGIYRVQPASVCYVVEEPLTDIASHVTIPLSDYQRAKKAIVREAAVIGDAVVKVEDGHTFRRGDRVYINKRYHVVVGHTTRAGDGYIRLSPALSLDLDPGYEILSLPNGDVTNVAAYEEWGTDLGLGGPTISVEGQVDGRLPIKTYRIVGVVIDPKDSDGNLCTLSYYDEAELFNLNKNGYDLGMLAHVMGVVPVRRNDLPEVETIRILL